MNAHTIIFFVGVSLAFSAVFWNNKAPEKQIHLLIAGAFLLRLSTCLDPFLHEWDERYHALVAKNLQYALLKPLLYPETPLAYQYTDWQSNAVWLHKQPLALWLISGAVHLFGNHAFAVRIPSLLLSTLAVYLTYQIGSWLFSAKVGLWAAFFQAINGLILEMTGGGAATDHIDIIFCSLIEIGICLSVFSWRSTRLSGSRRILLAVLIGFVTGLAILCKWLPGFIIVLLYAVLHAPQKRWLLNITVIIAATIATALPWQVYAAVHYPNEYWYEMHYNSRHFYEALEGHQHAVWYYIAQARINWNDLIYLPLLWLAYEVVRKKNRSRPVLLVAVWILVPYLVFTMARTKLPAYVLFTAPAMFIVSAYFLLQGIEKWPKTLRILLTGLFVLLALRYTFERARPFDQYANESAERAFIAGIDTFCNATAGTKKTIVFNAEKYVEIMFYTPHIAYPMNPSLEQVQAVTRQNYSIVILGDNVPKEILAFPNVYTYMVPKPLSLTPKR